MYRAVYVAQNGEELVMAEGAATREAAIEAAVAEAKAHDLIGSEWPRVTEDAFRAALRIDPA